jgi:hypothetical protein
MPVDEALASPWLFAFDHHRIIHDALNAIA